MTGDVRIVERTRHDRLGEGLLWSARDAAVYWTDILGQRISRLTLETDVVEEWAVPDMIGWLIERDRGGFVAGIGRSFVALSLHPFAMETIADPEPERSGNRFNDASCDARGRIFAGTMAITCDKPTGAFYRLDIDGRALRLEDGHTIPNGPAIGDDVLLHTDTALDTIFRYRVNDDGSLGTRDVFAVFEDGWGHPDGMAFDNEGCLWVACWGAGQVRRFSPDGRSIDIRTLPASQISNVAFAGDALDRMFVTSAAEGVSEAHAGALFEIDPGCVGRPSHRFAG